MKAGNKPDMAATYTERHPDGYVPVPGGAGDHDGTLDMNEAAAVRPHEFVRDTPGEWKVTRFCCTSGMCMTCRAVATGRSRIRIVHADGLSQEMAERMAANWSSYGATAVKEEGR